MPNLHDVLIVGAGPAGLALAAACCHAGLDVAGLTPQPPDRAWSNTYGIWADELDGSALFPNDPSDVLAHCWDDCIAYTDERKIDLHRRYALFDNNRLQAYLLDQCDRGAVTWRDGYAVQIDHETDRSRVAIRDGRTVTARVVVDASGHNPIFVRRPAGGDVAFQAAYGIVGMFSSPPVAPGQLMLMDYRVDHLTPEERRMEAPTFLYAMDLGGGRFFVEETSLAHAPAVSLGTLENRLHRRLAHAGIEIREVQHVERCLFPMNLPLPFRDQPVLGYGGAASMVHPATGYQVGAALKRSADVARAIARALDVSDPSPAQTADAGWQALWPDESVRKRALYLFGLQSLLRLNSEQTNQFFTAFFRLPRPLWTGYLSNTLDESQIRQTMLHIFGNAPNRVRGSLMQTALAEPGLLWQGLRGSR